MSTGLQGQKIMYTTLFMRKVCRKNPGFDKDKTDVMFGLTLHDCIFHFPLCTSQGIKVPFENTVMGLAHRSLVTPCHFLSLSFSFSWHWCRLSWGSEDAELTRADKWMQGASMLQGISLKKRVRERKKERKKKDRQTDRQTWPDQALVSEAHNFIFQGSFYTLTCT